jgi:transcriptional regulator with XRE-family HTH domain
MHPHRLRQPPPEFWHRPEVAAALVDRDMGALLRQYRGFTGASQTVVGLLVGLAQSHVSALERGRRRITSLELFERFADGLGIPRSLLGLNTLAEASDDARAQPRPSDVGRRAVLRTIGMAASAAGLVPDELVALLESKGPRLVDPRAVDAFGEVLHRAASLGPPVQPAHIQPTVQVVLERLVEAQQHPTTLALRRTVSQFISDAACFVGWLHYDRGHLAAARAHFALAADGARDAGDDTRAALVLASQGVSYSPAVDGGPGDVQRSLELLVGADRALALEPAHRAHAWVNVNAAARAASLGDRGLFATHRERARELQGREAEPMYGLWHWFPPRSVDRDWLDDYLCGGLVQLADPSAEATLRGIVARTSHGHRLADAYKLLMELHLARGDHDAAAAAGVAGLAAARAAGLERQDQRIRGLRAQAPGDERAYAELDAALNTGRGRTRPPPVVAVPGAAAGADV